MKIAFFIQARMGSNRLPGKVLMPFDGDKSILEIITSKIHDGDQIFMDLDADNQELTIEIKKLEKPSS